jgi:hypothetical protein
MVKEITVRPDDEPDSPKDRAQKKPSSPNDIKHQAIPNAP